LSHILTVLSDELDTKCTLSGEKAILRTHEPWPFGYGNS
jgi:hypothetical protein